MRIAYDTQSTIGNKTGIGQYTARLLAGMRSVAPELDLTELNQGRDVVMRTDRRLRWQQWGLPRQAQAAHVDLLHVTGFDAPVWKPLPIVLTVHDLIGMIFPQNLPPVARFYWSRWLPFTVRFADAIIADSEHTRQDIIRLLHTPGEKIRVIHLGIDESFQPQAAKDIEACRDRYGLPRDTILYVGTIEPRKGIDTLIDAYAKLADRYPHHLVIAGKRGWYWEPILTRISKYGIGERVHVLDYVSTGDLPAIYASAAVFAFPSRYEGFGFPVLEAMACGTPVVCSDASSLPEVAEQAALMMPPNSPEALADNLAAVLDSTTLRDDLRERGLRRAREFTWQKTALATLDVYRALLQSKTDIGRKQGQAQ